MVFRSGFLLIELLISIAIFISFLLVICSFQVLGLKNKDLAIKRMNALRFAIEQTEKIKRGDRGVKGNKNKDFSVKIQVLAPITGKQKNLKLTKVMIQGKALGNKYYSVSLIC